VPRGTSLFGTENKNVPKRDVPLGTIEGEFL